MYLTVEQFNSFLTQHNSQTNEMLKTRQLVAEQGVALKAMADLLDTLLGVEEDENRGFKAKQICRALQLLTEKAALSDSELMEIVDVLEAWQPDKEYKAGKLLEFGANIYGESQAYRVLYDHISAEGQNPELDEDNYQKIGFNDMGIPLWTQPLELLDAYDEGDRADHEGVLFVSAKGGNMDNPKVSGWHEEEGDG